MSNANGHRWSKFWWRDHQGDAALRACSLAARGYWMEMLCIAHEAEPMGHVLLNGRAPTIRQMAAIAGCTEKEARKLEAELEEAGVFSRTENGTIYSRRMVKDAVASDIGRESADRRWKPKDTQPPNGKPNGSPNGVGSREPKGYPNARSRSQESEEEPEREERKEVLKIPFFGEEMCARGEEPPEIASSEPDPPQPDKPEAVSEARDAPLPERFQVHVRHAARAMAMRIPYAEVRSIEAQKEGILAQPAAAGADVTMGLKWQPADPVRSIEAQREGVFAGCTPEQIAKARAAFAQRARQAA